MALFALLVFVAAFLTSAPNSAAESRHTFTVVSIQGSAWISHNKRDVKSSLRAGDILKPGSEIEVLQGNSVIISMDDTKENIIEIQGPSQVFISDDGISQFKVIDGKIFAFIDSLKKGRKFEVSTPVAVAAIRGTAIKVSASWGSSEFLVHEGKIEVRTLDPEGMISEGMLEVTEGQKVTIKGNVEKLPDAGSISDKEEAEFIHVQTRLKGVKPTTPKKPSLTPKTIEIHAKESDEDQVTVESFIHYDD